MYLSRRGHKVSGIDNLARRRWVEEIGGWSAIPISSMNARIAAFQNCFGHQIEFREGDLRDIPFLEACFSDWKPDAIIHLGEQPSAPYSMMDLNHASYTQENNVIGTLNVLFSMVKFTPEAHLVKLGTMGEYGTPNIPIP